MVALSPSPDNLTLALPLFTLVYPCGLFTISTEQVSTPVPTNNRFRFCRKCGLNQYVNKSRTSSSYNELNIKLHFLHTNVIFTGVSKNLEKHLLAHVCPSV